MPSTRRRLLSANATILNWSVRASLWVVKFSSSGLRMPGWPDSASGPYLTDSGCMSLSAS
jgi:hypothetical protein